MKYRAQQAITPVHRCARCGTPLPAAQDRRAATCKRCDKAGGAAPQARVRRRCRRCREPIDPAQSDTMCRDCRAAAKAQARGQT